MRIVGHVVIVGIVALGTIGVGGCSSSGETGESEGNFTPSSDPSTPNQKTLCEMRVRENGAFRNPDIDLGVVRWKCGDVKGVDRRDGVNDFGQEYCEFHAVQEGAVVDVIAKSKIKKAKVECVFTGVYRDVKGPPGSAKNIELGEKLNKQLLEAAGNLKDVKAGSKLEPQGGANPFSVMNGSFNSRGAASALLRDCQNAAGSAAAKARIEAAKDDVQCLPDGAGCSSPRDIEACALIDGNGVGWRNSDPVICGRAARGAICGATYGVLPPELDGFLMTDWQADLGKAVKYWAGTETEAPSAPDKCRYATIDGKPYLHMMICDPDDNQVENPKYNTPKGQDLQFMCTDVFGAKIAMTAPIGLVTQGAREEAGFCGQFSAGAKAIQSAAKK